MPHRDILAAIEEHEATLVGISATMLFNLPRVRSLIEDIRGTLRVCAPRIVVGGGAFRSCASFSEELGVDGPGRDVADALRLSAA
jgi:methanogenic corrinoid protein MtbC1